MEEYKFKVQPWMMWQRIDETMYLCDLRKERLFVLKDSAYEIAWGILAENKDLAQVIDEMVEKYDVKYETIKKDATKFIKKLETKGILAVVKNEQY